MRSPHIYSSGILLAVALLGSGCATLFPPDCAKFEEARKQTDYATQYQFSESKSKKLEKDFKPLAKNASAAAPLYRLEPGDKKVRTCTHLGLRKELYLQRRPNTGLVLEETREFYSENGTLIASKTENLGNQLDRSGYYSATVPLPIPESAPVGKYRIVSRLLLKSKDGKQKTLLARTSTNFDVIARK
jgi:hypothetical protein